MLFTGWLISRFKDNLLLELPSSLKPLIDKHGQHDPKLETDLPPKIITAALLIWNNLAATVRAMLLFFHARPRDRNFIIHTPPTMDEATSLIVTSGIPAAEKELAHIIVHMGAKRDEDQTWQPLFSCATATDKNKFDELVSQWNTRWKD